MIRSAGYSTSCGTSWSPVSSELSGTTNGGTIAVAADGTRVIGSRTGADVHTTSNNGTTWTAANLNLTQSFCVIGVTHPSLTHDSGAKVETCDVD